MSRKIRDDRYQDDDVEDGDDVEERARHQRADESGVVVQARAAVLDPLVEGFDPEVEQHGEDEHDGGVTEGEEEPDRERSLALGHELAGRVVDGRDVVGVEGVAQAQGVGQRAGTDPEGGLGVEVDVPGCAGEEQGEAQHMQEEDEPDHPPRPSPLSGCQPLLDGGEPGDLWCCGGGRCAHRGPPDGRRIRRF